MKDEFSAGEASGPAPLVCSGGTAARGRGARAWRSVAALSSGLSLLFAALGPAAAVAQDEPGLSRMLIDAHGLVLEEYLGDEPRVAPGVVPLLMVLLTLEQVGFGLFPIDVPVFASEAAAALPTAMLRLDPDETYRLEELLRAIVVTGAADATFAVADLICGTADACGTLLQRRVELLGMDATRLEGGIRQAGGDADRSTVRDVARLAQELLEHPETLRWSSQRGFVFDGGPVVLTNTNGLVGAVAEVDGLQAVRAGAHCSVIATGERAGTRLTAVVMGEGALEKCSKTALAVLDRGFDAYENVELVRAGESLRLSIEVFDGSVEHIVPIATASYSFSQRKGERSSGDFVLRYQIPARLEAPLDRDLLVGELIVERDGRVVAVIPARSPQRVVRRGLF